MRALFLSILILSAAPSAVTAYVLGTEAPPATCDRPAVPDKPPSVPDALVRELLEWIGRETGYDVADSLVHPPKVAFCQTGD